MVLLEGLKAGPTDMCTWGAPCPSLQGTVQASRTGGHIWEGSRGRARSQPCTEAVLSQPPAPPPHSRQSWPGLALAIVLGRPFLPTARNQDQEDKQSQDLSERPCPTHSQESPLQAWASPLHGNGLSPCGSTELSWAGPCSRPSAAPGLSLPQRSLCPGWEPRRLGLRFLSLAQGQQRMLATPPPTHTHIMAVLPKPDMPSYHPREQSWKT